MHWFLQTPLRCWGTDACFISDTGAFRAGFQGMIGFLSSNEHGIFFSQKLLTLLEHMMLGIFTFLLFSDVMKKFCLERGWLGRQMLGKGLLRLLFSFSLDFHPMVEVTALSLTSQISILVFGTQGFDPLFTNITPSFSPGMVLIQAAPGVLNGLRGVAAFSRNGKDFPILQRLWFLQLHR